VKPSKLRIGAGKVSLLWMMCFLLSCTGQNGRNVIQVENSESPSESVHLQADILFDTLSHDFGTIIEGERVLCYFEYENTGEGDLVITEVETTCGCTTSDWKKEPLKPGERAHLQVAFDTHGRSGAQLKPVAVKTNATVPVVWLTIKAKVIRN
jgi:hypothetical protein